MTIDYDLFREKLNALNGEIFKMSNEQQVLPVLAIHKILKECEVEEMTDKIKSEDFIKAFGSGVKETDHYLIKECKALEQTEAKGDLISREALKQAIENYLAKRQDVIIWETDMFDMLDNVPTVEDRYDEGYAQGYLDGSTGADWRGEE